MEGSKAKHQYYSDTYKTTDFVWAQSLGEGKLYTNHSEEQ